MTTLSMTGPAPARHASHAARRAVRRAMLGIVLSALASAAIVVAWRQPYAAGSDLGYALGLAGGLMMLGLFAYPLRKHLPWLRKLGPMRPWFQAHMVLGIGGPLLVLFHSGFRASSTNAAVALGCMVLVAGSGFIGRFAYGRIHHGLYGRRASLADMEARMGQSERGLAALLRAAPDVREALEGYRARAFDTGGGSLARLWRLVRLGAEGRRLADRLDDRVVQVVVEAGPRRQWNGREQTRRARRGFALLRGYLATVQAAAQFSAFERLFSAWHLLHVPLVYLMLASACYHVLAVHMY